jgi:hypothetical protein
MRATYKVLGHLIAGLVVVQAAAIALWVFGLLHWIDDGKGHSLTPQLSDDRLEGVTGSVGIAIHSFGAIAVALVAIVLLIISFFAKFNGAVKWAGFVFLAVLLQWVFAIASFETPGLGVLHGANAILVAWLGWRAAKQASVVDVVVPAASEGAAAR